MKTTVLVDLDGTLFNVDHREDLAKASQWDEFHSLIPGDAIYSDVIEVVNKLGAFNNIVAVTARPEKWRNLTNDQLNKHCPRVDIVLMRKDNDYRPSPEVKIDLLEEYFGSKEAVLSHVLCMFEDHEKVTAKLRDYGITVFQVREGLTG